MKSLYLTVISLFFYVLSFSQSIVYSEDFENTLSVTSSSSSGTAADWDTTSRIQAGGNYCDTNFVQINDTVWLTTNAFSTIGNTYVLLDFDHICKIEFFDGGIIQVSPDSGQTWIKLTSAEYLGTSNFSSQGEKFTAGAYSTWDLPNPTSVPDNSWWKHEQFDISALIPNVNNAMIRFALFDGNANGANQHYGWYIDNITVTAAPCELIPPNIVLNNPYPSGIVYNLGPFVISTDVTDASGVDSVLLIYTINGGFTDTLYMNYMGGNTYQDTIPVLNDSDNVCYYIYAVDSSLCSNSSRYPTSSCISFTAYSGITFPYFENFDSGNNLWHDSSVTAGTKWELGTPNYGTTNSAYSPPNSWDINLTTAYGSNAKSYLISPVFDFSSTVNATLSFWQNRNTESSWDGFRIDYSTDGGTTWQILGSVGDPNATNWYTNAYINSSGQAAWDGSSSGWIQSTYDLSFLNNNPGKVKFRFVFTSDGIVQYDGVSIDNFLIDIPLNNDLGVIAINSPNTGCSLSANELINIDVKNFGLFSQDTIPVAYNVNGGPVVIDTIFTNLLTDSVINFTFSIPANLSSFGTYTIKAWTQLSNEEYKNNDTTTIIIDNLSSTIVTIPDNENFDSFVNCSESCGTACSSISGEWFNSIDDGIVDWIVDNNGTPTANTGPIVDHTTGLPTGNYIYLESSGCNFETANLESVCLDISGIVNPALSFYYHMYGANTGKIYVDINIGGTWSTIDSIVGQQQLSSSDAWLQKTVNLSTYPTNIKLRIRGIIGNGSLSDMAIDDIGIISISDIDLGVSKILYPTISSISGNNDSIEVEVKNYGVDTIFSFNVAYKINNGAPVIESINDTILPGAVYNYKFLTTYTVPSSAFTICAYTIHSLDTINNFNDTTCKTFASLPLISLSDTNYYFNDFEGTTQWVSSGGFNQWEKGIPLGTTINTAYSPVNVWMIDLDNTYQNNSNDNLYTVYFDFSNASNTLLSFYHWIESENFNDGGRIDYTLDNGKTWQTLGTVGDINATNWYSSSSITSSGLAGWEGQSGNYMKSTYRLNFLNNVTSPVQFRFNFSSNSSINTTDGWAIDNFSLIVPPAKDAGVTRIIKPISPTLGNKNTSVKVVFTNFGTDTIFSTDIAYTVNGGAPVIETWTGVLAPFDSTVYLFTTPFTSPVGNYTICAYTMLTGDTLININDTSCKNLTGIPIITVTYSTPYVENFDSTTSYWWSADGFQQWELGTPSASTINYPFSPPNVWMIDLDNNYQNNSNDNLYTVYFDFSNSKNAVLSFYHWYDSESLWDGCRIDFSTDTGQTWQILGSVGDPNATNWYNTSINLTGQARWSGQSSTYIKSTYDLTFLNNFNGIVQFRFNFSSDASVNNYNGWAIDNFSITVPPPVSASADSIIVKKIAPLPVPGAYTVKARVRNTGINDLDSVEMVLNIDGNTLSTEKIIFSNPLLTGQSNIYTFNYTWQASAGIHKIKVWVQNPNDTIDLYNADDTVSMNFTVFDSTGVFPYCTDFDSLNQIQWFTLNSFTYEQQGTSWELGTPSQTVINSAHSGTNVWMIDLDNNYKWVDSSSLFTPMFRIDSGLCYKISFWHIFETQKFHDGGILEYSFNRGSSWGVVGSDSDTSWYNSYYVAGISNSNKSLPGWSGSSGGWKFAQHFIKFQFPAQVIFRFRFGSDASIFDEGWAIDDFCFEEFGSCSIPPITSIKEGNSVLEFQLYPNPANNEAILIFENKKEQNIKISVKNVLGAEIMKKYAFKEAGKQILSINTSKLKEGMYFISIEGNDFYKTLRLIVNH